MVTTVTRETESNPVMSAPVAEPVTAAPAVDISGVPESPAELLKQWDAPAPKRPLIHAVVMASLVRIWDAITGPGMTEHDRVRREIAEFSGHRRAYGPHV